MLGICGSLQAESGNLRLLRKAAALMPANVEFAIYEGIDALPFFRSDMDPSDVPESVHRFRKALKECDAVLIASPEYGHSLPGVLKNAIDWVIGSGELYKKRVAVTASAPGPGRGERGLAALCATLRGVDARIVGGDPIVRGPDEDEELAVLIEVLVSNA